MQSSGGLTDAHLFQGKDAILSGPAGGIVGAVEVSRLAGFDKIIGFDMGGTSTDVTHWAGEYERAFATEVAGVRLRAPMMRIHTVAAGGGSICTFDGARFRVGPESAGANPGPASYRRGGPLAVTDCNVMVGKLDPALFPKVFGPDGNAPLDADVVRVKFAALADEIASATGIRRTPEADRRRLPQDRRREHGERDQAHLGGARLRRHRVHAVLLRRRRRPARVRRRGCARHDARVHPSARGRAVRVRHGARGRPQPAPAGGRDAGSSTTRSRSSSRRSRRSSRRPGPRCGSRASTIRGSAPRGRCISSTKAPTRRSKSPRARIFRTSSPRSSAVTGSNTDSSCRASRWSSRRSRSRRWAARSRRPTSAPHSSRETGALRPLQTNRVYTNAAFHDAPVYAREDLRPGDAINGPSILRERNATTVIEPGWRATPDGARPSGARARRSGAAHRTRSARRRIRCCSRYSTTCSWRSPSRWA